jgi:hypothetical protein
LCSCVEIIVWLIGHWILCDNHEIFVWFITIFCVILMKFLCGFKKSAVSNCRFQAAKDVGIWIKFGSLILEASALSSRIPNVCTEAWTWSHHFILLRNDGPQATRSEILSTACQIRLHQRWHFCKLTLLLMCMQQIFLTRVIKGKRLSCKA